LNQDDNFLLTDKKCLEGDKLLWEFRLIKLWSINSVLQTNLKAVTEWSLGPITTHDLPRSWPFVFT